MERCKDPFAWFEFLGQRVETFPQKHSETLDWNHTAVFFVGLQVLCTLCHSTCNTCLVVPFCQKLLVASVIWYHQH